MLKEPVSTITTPVTSVDLWVENVRGGKEWPWGRDYPEVTNEKDINLCTPFTAQNDKTRT